MEPANSSAEIAKLKVSDAAVHVKPADIGVGFAATGTLAGLLRQKIVGDLEAFEFRKEHASVLAAIVIRIQEWKPSQVSLCKKTGKLGSRADVRKA